MPTSNWQSKMHKHLTLKIKPFIHLYVAIIIWPAPIP